MKNTGIIRRIDDLGRIVIPKEVRRSMHLREGDPIGIYVDDGTVMPKAASDLNGLEAFAGAIVKALQF